LDVEDALSTRYVGTLEREKKKKIKDEEFEGERVKN